MSKSLVGAYEQALKFVLQNIEEHRGRWPEICTATGISYFTLQKIAQRTIDRPSVELLQTLSDYFRKAA